MQIVCENLSFCYSGQHGQDKAALQHLNLTLDTDVLTGICGTTGTGKSTFSRHLNGILTPTSGRILIDGADLHGSAEMLRRTRQRIGMGFQFPERQFFGRTVWEELRYVPEQRRLPQPELETRIAEVSALLGIDLAALRDESPFALSRARQRKLGLAALLVLQPELLVLDEPTAGLDRGSAHRLLEGLRDLHERKVCHVMLISHDLELLLQYADQLMLLHEGRLAFHGSVEEVLHQPERLTACHLSLPPVHRLLQLLRQHEPELSSAVRSQHDAL